jgi:hypothetical protein
MHKKYYFFIVISLLCNSIFLYAAHSRFASFRNIATGSGVLMYSFWQSLLYDLQKNNYEIALAMNRQMEKQIQSNNENIDKQIKSSEYNLYQQISNQNKAILISAILPFLLIMFEFFFQKIVQCKKKIIKKIHK